MKKKAENILLCRRKEDLDVVYFVPCPCNYIDCLDQIKMLVFHSTFKKVNLEAKLEGENAKALFFFFFFFEYQPL